MGAAGAIGAISGAATTSLLIAPLGPMNLMLVSVALLEVAALSARRLLRFAAATGDGGAARVSEAEQATGMGGSVWEGMRRSLTSAYFVNISVHMLLFTVLTTFLYFQQAALVDQAFTDRAERTRFFANIDLLVNLITLTTQTLATGWFIRAFGVVAALAALPALSVAGFAVLGAAPTVSVLMAFQVLRRSLNFARQPPGAQVLFTVVSSADRYKTKGFIDTVVYRAGDQIGAWAYLPMAALGLGIPASPRWPLRWRWCRWAMPCGWDAAGGGGRLAFVPAESPGRLDVAGRQRHAGHSSVDAEPRAGTRFAGACASRIRCGALAASRLKCGFERAPPPFRSSDSVGRPWKGDPCSPAWCGPRPWGSPCFWPEPPAIRPRLSPLRPIARPSSSRTTSSTGSTPGSCSASMPPGSCRPETRLTAGCWS